MISDVLHIMSDEPSVSRQLLARGAATWAAAVGHPMVRQIGDGTLARATFRYYFGQNILYLIDYARAISLTVSKAPDLAAVDVLTRFLHQIVRTEIPANIDFYRRLGGSGETAAEPSRMDAVTYGYTCHLLSSCALGDCATGLTAVLPCQWSYGELAAPLMSALPTDPIHADWIAMFGNDAYGALVEETTGLLDRLAARSGAAGGAELDRLGGIFDRSVSYELRFWDMAYDCGGTGGSASDKE